MTNDIKLTGIFDLDHLTNALVKPSLVFGVDHFFIDYWLPLLGPARSWLVVALQQACWIGRTPGRVARISQAELGRQCGLSRHRINIMLNRDEWLTWFVLGKQPHVEQGKIQTNSYTVRLNTPLTPALAAGLQREIAVRLDERGRAPAEILQSLIRDAKENRTRLLDRLTLPEMPPSFSRQTVRQIVGEFVSEALSDELQELATALARLILQPDRRDLETQYFRKQWVPLLAPGPAWLVMAVRRRCYAGGTEIRNDFSVGKSEMARRLGVSGTTLRRFLQNEYLPEFFQTDDGDPWQPGHFRLAGRVRMTDPLTPADQNRSRQWQKQAVDSLPIVDRDEPDASKNNTVTRQKTTGSAADAPKSHTVTRQKATAIQHLNQHLQNQHLQHQHKNGGGAVLSEVRAGLIELGINEPKLSRVAGLEHLTQSGYLAAWQTWYAAQSEFKPGWVILQLEAGLWPPGWSETGERRPSASSWLTEMPTLSPKNEDPEPIASTAGKEEQQWQSVLEQLQGQMTAATFNVWLKETRVISLNDDELMVDAGNDFARSWLAGRLSGAVHQAAADVFGRAVTVKFLTADPAG